MAEHIKLKDLRAIKRIRKDHILHGNLLKEAYILKNLRHSCIPIIYDFEEDDHYSYIIEQYIKGQSLQQFLGQWVGKIKESTIVEIGIQICDLLQYLYSLENPILYLDLQPNNIIISEEKVKLIDFGASTYKKEIHKRGYSLGTKGFAAPELFRKQLPCERTDIYGVGALLYYMVTGKSCEQSISLRDNKRLGQCSKQLKSIIKTCLNHNQFYRYSSINILKRKLLVLNEKKKTVSKRSLVSKEPTSIAIAGSQSRIGVTHLSILVSSYLNQNGLKSLYIENNKSHHVNKILEEKKNIRVLNGVFQMNNCYMIPSYEIKMPIKIDDYQFHIVDFGILNNDNIDEFLNMDYKAVILGGKEWEFNYNEAVLKLLHEEKNIKYLFNFLDSEKYIAISKKLKGLPCYRVPYEPKLFEGKMNETMINFMEGFIDY